MFTSFSVSIFSNEKKILRCAQNDILCHPERSEGSFYAITEKLVLCSAFGQSQMPITIIKNLATPYLQVNPALFTSLFSYFCQQPLVTLPHSPQSLLAFPAFLIKLLSLYRMLGPLLDEQCCSKC